MARSCRFFSTGFREQARAFRRLQLPPPSLFGLPSTDIWGPPLPGAFLFPPSRGISYLFFLLLNQVLFISTDPLFFFSLLRFDSFASPSWKSSSFAFYELSCSAEDTSNRFMYSCGSILFISPLLPSLFF